MNKELILALEALEKENGISKDVMLDTIEKSLKDEFRSQFKTIDNCEVTLDRVTGDYHIYAYREVVEELTPVAVSDDPNRKGSPKSDVPTGKEILLEEARQIDPKCQIGDTVKVEIKSEEFSRRAAKTAKGTIVQKIREEEKAALYNEYHSKEHEIITGIVQRIDENGNVLVDIGRTQTTLKKSECVKGEVLERGDRIKLYVLEVSNVQKEEKNSENKTEVKSENKGDKEKSGRLVIRVSRNTPKLVERLFENEVSEIRDGIVEIVGIAREAGSRTKIAVRAKDPNVDAVGACVGVNGARVRAIVNELGNEQIDVIEWNENPAQYIFNALSPAKAVSIHAYDDTASEESDENMDETEGETDGRRKKEVNKKKAKVIVSDQQLSLAIGKAGQNVRLAAKLTGYGIDIKSESAVEAEQDSAVNSENDDYYGNDANSEHYNSDDNDGNSEYDGYDNDEVLTFEENE
jgi:N utilization substance protein A